MAPSLPLRATARRCTRPAVAVALLAVLGAGTPATAAPTRNPGRVTFGVEPVTLTGGLNRPQFSFGATDGALLSDRVALLNYSPTPLQLQLYATDALTAANGGLALLAPGAAPHGVGAWISLPASTGTVLVPAERGRQPGHVLVPFTLRVPASASPGDHLGALVASLRSVGHTTSGHRIILNQRVGTRVLVRVAGTLRPAFSITDVHADYHGTWNPLGSGSVAVSWTLRNTGNLELRVSQAVSVDGLLGGSTHVSAPAVPLLLPGDAVHESVVAHGVFPQVVGDAKVTARPAAVPGDQDPHLAAQSADAHTLEVPWALLALVVLVAGAVAAHVVRLRRRARGRHSTRAARERVGVPA